MSEKLRIFSAVIYSDHLVPILSFVLVNLTTGAAMMQRTILTQIRRAVTVTSRSSLKCFSTVIEPSKTVVTMTTKPKVDREYVVMTYYF